MTNRTGTKYVITYQDSVYDVYGFWNVECGNGQIGSFPSLTAATRFIASKDKIPSSTWTTPDADFNGYFWFGQDRVKSGSDRTPVKYDIRESERTTAQKSHFYVVVTPANHPDAVEAGQRTYWTYSGALAWVDSKRYPKTQELKKIWDVAGDMLKAERRLAEYKAEHQVEDSRILAKAATECMWAEVLRERESFRYTIEPSEVSGPVATWKVLYRGNLVKYFDSYLEADAWINEQEGFLHPHHNAQGVKINPPAPGEQTTGYKQV